MIAKRVFYEGKVQGVGFRYSVKRLAMGFDVAGTIQNLPDGRVELLAIGDEGELCEFLGGIVEGELAGFSRDVQEELLSSLPDVSGFEIVR